MSSHSPPRLSTLLTRPVTFAVDTTVALLVFPVRVLGLVADAEQTLANVNDLVNRTQAHLEQIGRIITQLDAIVADASRAVSEPPRRLEPAVRRMANTTGTHEVDAMVTLIDRLPRLAHAMDGDVIPLLSRVEKIGPDLDQLLDNVCDLDHMMDRMPRVFRHRRASPAAES